jgi:hypothetical protein
VVPLEAFVELTIELAMPVIGDSALRIPGSTSVRGAEHRMPFRAFLGLFGVLEESELSHLPDVIVPVCQEESSAGDFPPLWQVGVRPGGRAVDTGTSPPSYGCQETYF